MPETIFFRSAETPNEDKPNVLAGQVRSLKGAGDANGIYHGTPTRFAKISGMPFAYWVDSSILAQFASQSPLREKAQVRQGSATADDFRFLRTWWEVPSSGIAFSVEQTQEDSRWVHFSKGGKFSPFYCDIWLVVDWFRHGDLIRNFERAFIRNELEYFRPALTWPLRTNGLSFRPLPCGCIFGHKGPALLVDNDDAEMLFGYLAIANSSPFAEFVRAQLARTELARSYEVGLIQNSPVPNLQDDVSRSLLASASRAHNFQRDADRFDETAHVFGLVALPPDDKDVSVSSAQSTLEHNTRSNLDELSKIAFKPMKSWCSFTDCPAVHS